MLCFVACTSSRNSISGEERNFYEEVFCVMQNEKLNFKTPNNPHVDSLYIYEAYYIDRSSIYYNMLNVGFHQNFFVSNIGTQEKWKFYSYINELAKLKLVHNINLSCYENSNLKFISRKEILENNFNSRIFMYSPLIKKLNGDYIIYEQEYGDPEYCYSYVFRMIEGEIKFVDREFYTGGGNLEVTDYLNTVNFNQSYSDFLKSLN